MGSSGEYVVCKHGRLLTPNAGFTDDIREAGRWTNTDARARTQIDPDAACFPASLFELAAQDGEAAEALRILIFKNQTMAVALRRIVESNFTFDFVPLIKEIAEGALEAETPPREMYGPHPPIDWGTIRKARMA